MVIQTLEETSVGGKIKRVDDTEWECVEKIEPSTQANECKSIILARRDRKNILVTAYHPRTNIINGLVAEREEARVITPTNPYYKKYDRKLTE